MPADFLAGGRQSPQWIRELRPVWLAAAFAELAIAYGLQPDRPAGVIAGAALDVLAATGVLPRAQAIALATAAGPLAQSGGNLD